MLVILVLLLLLYLPLTLLVVAANNEDFLIFEEIEIDPTTGEQRMLQKRIAGGRDSAKNPSYGISAGDDLCGAILIHPDILLTAAHCFGAFISNGILMGVTKLDGSDNDEYIQIIKELPHPNYDNVLQENDIMLIQLQQSSVAPVRLFSTDPIIPNVGETLTVIGFGLTSSGGSSSDILQEAEVVVTDHEICKEKYIEINQIVADDIMFCSGGTGIGACPGDSGGPLFHSGDIIVGIVSWGYDCGAVGFFDISTRVSIYTNWIRESICCISAVPPDDCPTDLICPDDTTDTVQDTNSPSSEGSNNTTITESPSPVSDGVTSAPDDNSTTSTLQPSSVPTSSTNGTDDGTLAPNSDNTTTNAEPTSVPSSDDGSTSGPNDNNTTNTEPTSVPSSDDGSTSVPSDNTTNVEPTSIPSTDDGSTLAPSDNTTNTDPTTVPSSDDGSTLAPSDNTTNVEPTSIPSTDDSSTLAPSENTTNTEPTSIPSTDDGSTLSPSDNTTNTEPTPVPSLDGSGSGTDLPSIPSSGTIAPTQSVSEEPSDIPSIEPSIGPTQQPIPTMSPKPTNIESVEPSAIPNNVDPSVQPTSDPVATESPDNTISAPPTPAPTRAPTRPVIDIIYGYIGANPPTGRPTISPAPTPSSPTTCSDEHSCKFFFHFEGFRVHSEASGQCISKCYLAAFITFPLSSGWECGPCPLS